MAGLYNPPPNYYATILGGALTKRKVFFSFHYADIMRVNNVRNAWKISHPESESTRGFYDGSLWETKKRTSDDAVKNLIRDGVQNTSAVCVLIGTETWLRRWVRYEIARAIVDERGLLGVHINGLKHHQSLPIHSQGLNPLDFMGIQKVQQNALSIPQYNLVSKSFYRDAYGNTQSRWDWYDDYITAVKKPKWLPDPSPGYVMPLSAGAKTYDYISQVGHSSIGNWIDNAAIAAGR